ncbi:uncharacterized protein G2W53_007133 [Senna tora]|uniref:Uncharacterized protein n=1 Tax=Senna tora TaxID=362788 RepID=A0A835CEN1_9FABA|nr:uncharacterized protein G2W53_007133 [Senna tora]
MGHRENGNLDQDQQWKVTQ